MKNKTIVITGKSSSGKDSLQNHLVSNYDFINLVSHTTRPPRPNESNGYDYYFINKEDFINMNNKDLFVETREYRVNTENGNDIWYYGLSKSELDITTILNKIVILDFKGMRELAEYVGRDNLFVVYLDCDSDTRIDRMTKRGGMTDEEISRRFKADELDFIGMEENADLCANTGEYSTEDIAKIIAGVFDVE
jgi:guanylate kinase